MSILRLVKIDNYIRLKDISDISIGEFVRKDKQNDNYEYPVYNGGTTNTGYYFEYNNEGNKIIISARGAAGFVNRVFTKYWAGNSCYSIKITSKSLNVSCCSTGRNTSAPRRLSSLITLQVTS